MKAFPEAKVVATTRNPDTWFDSWWSSIGLTLEAIESQPIKWVLSLLENPDLKRIHGPARKLVPKGCSMSLDEAFQVTLPIRFFRELVFYLNYCSYWLFTKGCNHPGGPYIYWGHAISLTCKANVQSIKNWYLEFKSMTKNSFQPRFWI